MKIITFDIFVNENENKNENYWFRWMEIRMKIMCRMRTE